MKTKFVNHVQKDMVNSKCLQKIFTVFGNSMKTKLTLSISAEEISDIKL